MTNLEDLTKKYFEKNDKDFHDSLVDVVFERLNNKRKDNEIIFKNIEYNRGGYVGEFDVLKSQESSHSNFLKLVYYECKSLDNPKNYLKAVKQFNRAEKAFPQCNWRFVYVTPERVKLYHSGDFVWEWK